MIRLAVTGALTLLVVAFALANLQVVELQTVFSEGIRASLALLLFGAFVCGFAFATVVNVHLAIKKKLRDQASFRRQTDADYALLPPPPEVDWKAVKNLTAKGRRARR